MNIPFYGIKRFYEARETEIMEVLRSSYASGQLFGSEVTRLEQALCEYTGRRYACSVNSCTDALYFALVAAGVKPGDKVLVTSFSFIASASPILRAGAIPVFVDIDPVTYLMDTADLEKKIDKSAKAIIGVHLFGQTLEIEHLERIAEAHGLVLIEDAAQALGAVSYQRKAGTMGKISCLSFDPTKVISAFGSGGAILTDDKEVGEMIRKLRYHGKYGDDYLLTGYNSRLPGPQCALLEYQLKQLMQDRINRQRAIAAAYTQALSTVPEIELPHEPDGNYHIYHKYVISTGFRNELKDFLKTKGVDTMVHYGKPLPQHTMFLGITAADDTLKNCAHACSSVLSLPVFPELTDREVAYICDTIIDFFAKKK